MLLVLAKRWFWMWTHLANSFLWPFTLHLPIFDELIVHFRRIRQIKSPSLKKVSEGGRGGEGREQERKSQFQLSSSSSRLKAEYPKRDPAQLLSLFLIDQLKETSFPWILFCLVFFSSQIHYFPGPGSNGSIVRPNSMWTAGCCVWEDENHKEMAQSIAVMGNNDFESKNIAIKSMTLVELEKMLVYDGDEPVSLFPAVKECRINSSKLPNWSFKITESKYMFCWFAFRW